MGSRWAKSHVTNVCALRLLGVEGIMLAKVAAPHTPRVYSVLSVLIVFVRCAETQLHIPKTADSLPIENEHHGIFHLARTHSLCVPRFGVVR